jgi:alkylation response protein AidB-like acyl-CoA dehydrogenase
MANPSGGAFLLGPTVANDVFTPEDFTAEHLAIARTTDEFWHRELAPNIEALQHQEPGLGARLLRRSAELGLTAVTVPEAYGGMEMDLVSLLIVAEHVSRDGSYSAWHGAHSGIGTLPLLLYGTPEQKQRWLPRLASAELIGAYCLSEPQAGSDALAARTTATLTADGRHYVLNGQKMWITNGGAADLFTVFAKINGEHFSAFLVERTAPGLSVGAEEKKMGIHGSSTCAVFLDQVAVPVDHLLGEVGRGHAIAFNVLNLGRLKLGAFVLGGAKEGLRLSLQYAAERRAFGRAIGDFGMIRAKLARMAARIYATEAMTWRLAGMIEARQGAWSWAMPDAAQLHCKAVEEFAAECSWVKVFASEMMDFVADEAVQIHGGYGYHRDYAVERAYRDARINRIFEGTNEINRLFAAGWLLKKAQRGQLALVDAVKSMAAMPTGTASEAARVIVLQLFGAAWTHFREGLEKEQEVMAGLSDCAMLLFAIESCQLRTRERNDLLAQLYCAEAFPLLQIKARRVLAACGQVTAAAKLPSIAEVDAIGVEKEAAAKLIAAGRYGLC